MDLTLVRRWFKKQKIVTIDQLAIWLSCSVVTAHRRLKVMDAYTSYNRNGRYYTLPEVAQFDNIGLWRHQGVFIERLWRSVKYEEIYPKEYDNVGELIQSLRVYFKFYNEYRPHASLNSKTPDDIYIRGERIAA